MSKAGVKIIQGLKQAFAGELVRVTIEGVTWVREGKPDLRAENTQLRERLNAIVNYIDTNQDCVQVSLGLRGGRVLETIREIASRTSDQPKETEGRSTSSAIDPD